MKTLYAYIYIYIYGPINCIFNVYNIYNVFLIDWWFLYLVYYWAIYINIHSPLYLICIHHIVTILAGSNHHPAIPPSPPSTLALASALPSLAARRAAARLRLGQGPWRMNSILLYIWEIWYIYPIYIRYIHICIYVNIYIIYVYLYIYTCIHFYIQMIYVIPLVYMMYFKMICMW